MTVCACVFGAGRSLDFNAFGYAYLFAWAVGNVVIGERYGHSASLIWSIFAGAFLAALFVLVAFQHGNQQSDAHFVGLLFGPVLGFGMWTAVRFVFYTCFRLPPTRARADRKCSHGG